MYRFCIPFPTLLSVNLFPSADTKKCCFWCFSIFFDVSFPCLDPPPSQCIAFKHPLTHKHTPTRQEVFLKNKCLLSSTPTPPACMRKSLIPPNKSVCKEKKLLQSLCALPVLKKCTEGYPDSHDFLDEVFSFSSKFLLGVSL